MHRKKACAVSWQQLIAPVHNITRRPHHHPHHRHGEISMYYCFSYYFMYGQNCITRKTRAHFTDFDNWSPVQINNNLIKIKKKLRNKNSHHRSVNITSPSSYLLYLVRVQLQPVSRAHHSKVNHNVVAPFYQFLLSLALSPMQEAFGQDSLPNPVFDNLATLQTRVLVFTDSGLGASQV